MQNIFLHDVFLFCCSAVFISHKPNPAGLEIFRKFMFECFSRFNCYFVILNIISWQCSFANCWTSSFDYPPPECHLERSQTVFQQIVIQFRQQVYVIPIYCFFPVPRLLKMILRGPDYSNKLPGENNLHEYKWMLPFRPLRPSFQLFA